MSRLIRVIFLYSFPVLMLMGCLSPVALNRAVEVYDAAAIQAESKQLLTNIVRAQFHQPLHFTRVSNIAATFDFTANAGATPAITGDRGGLLMPLFGGSVSENSTFSIDPIASDEFTKRLLTPFSQHKLTLLLRQHFDVDLMLRMMAQEVRLQNRDRLAADEIRKDETITRKKRQQRFRKGEKKQRIARQIPDEIAQYEFNKFFSDIHLTEEQSNRVRQRQKRHFHQVIYHNNPADRVGYEMFRRVVLHLLAIQKMKHLYAEPLTFERSWAVPINLISIEGIFQAIENEFAISLDKEGANYILSKQLLGPILITNYDPDLLCCEERAELNDLINPWIEHDVAFDIRPGYPGGEWPIQGSFRLRSFHTILNFLGHSLNETAEYAVDKDPRTPFIARGSNPSHTLGLIVSEKRPSGTDLYTYANGKYYSVDATSHWDLNAFQLLYILFRLTITDAKSLGIPITIAK